jgi:GNAT superfamily N-acetyltransferase
MYLFMSQVSKTDVANSGDASGGAAGFAIIRVDRELESAAMAVLSGAAEDGAGLTELSVALGHSGPSDRLMWAAVATPRADGLSPLGRAGAILDVAIVMPGAGRTASVYLSPPLAARSSGRSAATAVSVPPAPHRVALIRRAHSELATARVEIEGLIRSGAIPANGGAGRNGGQIPLAHVAQVLLKPTELAEMQTYEAAGFIRLAELAYMRREWTRLARFAMPDIRTHSDLSIVPLSQFDSREGDRLLLEAMAESYQDTLDCPALCGMRRIEDVLASHRAVGRYDPSLWWVVLQQVLSPEGTIERFARGCCLISRLPKFDGAELVYLGLGPAVRGRGLGMLLLQLAFHHLHSLGERSLACAVDLANTPALRLYKRAKLQQFAERVAMVAPVGG